MSTRDSSHDRRRGAANDADAASREPWAGMANAASGPALSAPFVMEDETEGFMFGVGEGANLALWSAVAAAAAETRFAALLCCRMCGYWNPPDAEFCRDCGNLSQKSAVSAGALVLPTNDPLLLLCAVGVFALLAYYFPCVTIPLFFVAGFGYHRLQIRRRRLAREGAASAAKKRVTLRGEENLFKRRQREIIDGAGEFDALLRDRNIGGEDREAVESGHMTLERQLLNVNSRLNEFGFFRWQNRVEAAAAVVGALGANFAGNVEALRQELFALYEEGEQIGSFWERRGGTDVYQEAASEYLPRIKTLREACLQLEKRVGRFKLLHAFSRIKRGVEDAGEVSAVTLDNPRAANTVNTLIDVTVNHLDEGLLFERLRVEAIGEDSSRAKARGLLGGEGAKRPRLPRRDRRQNGK